MPGFNTGGSGEGEASTTETLREHRWKIAQLGPVNGKSSALFFAKELSLPEYRFDRQEILGTTLWYKFAKSIKWEDCRVLFYDTGKILPELYKWREMVYTFKEGIKVHSDKGSSGYKKECTFELLDGAGKEIYTTKLFGAWPSQISEGKLDYSSSAIKLVTVTLAYDYATMKEKGAKEGSGEGESTWDPNKPNGGLGGGSVPPVANEGSDDEAEGGNESNQNFDYGGGGEMAFGKGTAGYAQ